MRRRYAPFNYKSFGVLLGCCSCHGAHGIGVVGHHQPVQRPRELERDAGVGNDLFALREAVGVFDRRGGTEQDRVPARHRVDVNVSPKDVLERVVGPRRRYLQRW